jgi:hypothetical protein
MERFRFFCRIDDRTKLVHSNSIDRSSELIIFAYLPDFLSVEDIDGMKVIRNVIASFFAVIL